VIPQDWRGRWLAVATRHGKARALRSPLRCVLGVRLCAPRDLGTDALGTFTGEIPRTQPPLCTAAAKACQALASEGSVGPDPMLGYVPLHRKWLVYVTASAPQATIVVGLPRTPLSSRIGNWPRTRCPPNMFCARWDFPRMRWSCARKPSRPVSGRRCAVSAADPAAGAQPGHGAGDESSAGPLMRILSAIDRRVFDYAHHRRATVAPVAAGFELHEGRGA
jgi:hypothetical protein